MVNWFVLLNELIYIVPAGFLHGGDFFIGKNNLPQTPRSYGLVLGKAEGWTIRPRTRPGLVRGFENIFTMFIIFYKKEAGLCFAQTGPETHNLKQTDDQPLPPPP